MMSFPSLVVESIVGVDDLQNATRIRGRKKQISNLHALEKKNRHSARHGHEVRCQFWCYSESEEMNNIRI